MITAARTAGMGLTVFSEFSKLAQEHDAINLGQGFPDFDGPDEIKAVAAAAIARGDNQYAFTRGVLALREAIAAHALRFYDQRVDPGSEVLVTSGATEAILDAVMALVDPGSEVILFQPAYDSYAASVQLAGGVVRSVILQPPDGTHTTWWFDERALAAAFSDRTRLVIVNTPHNPTGKVFTRDELMLVGHLAQKHGAVLLADEVYEHLVFARARHLRLATLFPASTITVSSGGKSFSFTGWKIGWALGPAALITAMANVHQWVTFATAAPFQHAIAHALRLPDSYFSGFITDYTRKRDLLGAALVRAGLPVLPCEGSYFLIADISRLGHTSDVAACRALTQNARVAAIPPSVFYAPERGPQNFARFAFCKRDDVLQQAADRLTTNA